MFYKMVVVIENFINDLLLRLLPKYRAKCFYRDLSLVSIPGAHDWNAYVLDGLLRNYSYKKDDAVMGGQRLAELAKAAKELSSAKVWGGFIDAIVQCTEKQRQ